MNKPKLPVINYGLISDISIIRDNDSQNIFLKGTGAQSNQWVHQSTQRAVHQLWFSLTHVLFPEKANHVTSMAATAVLSASEPGITTFFEAKYDPQKHTYEIIGWIGERLWAFELNDEKARKLWTALDLLIYPAGWEGKTTTHRPTDSH